jgi:hypothetical protein
LARQKSRKRSVSKRLVGDAGVLPQAVAEGQAAVGHIVEGAQSMFLRIGLSVAAQKIDQRRLALIIQGKW